MDYKHGQSVLLHSKLKRELTVEICSMRSDLKADVQHMKKSTSIDGDLHKGLADVENSVSECEAGVRTVLQSVEAVGVRIQQLERAHKQTDESAISRIAAQVFATCTHLHTLTHCLTHAYTCVYVHTHRHVEI